MQNECLGPTFARLPTNSNDDKQLWNPDCRLRYNEEMFMLKRQIGRHNLSLQILLHASIGLEKTAGMHSGLVPAEGMACLD